MMAAVLAIGLIPASAFAQGDGEHSRSASGEAGEGGSDAAGELLLRMNRSGALGATTFHISLDNGNDADLKHVDLVMDAQGAPQADGSEAGAAEASEGDGEDQSADNAVEVVNPNVKPEVLVKEAFISGISDGSYTLTVQAENYLTYTQALEFDGRCIQLNLFNHASANYNDITGENDGVVRESGDSAVTYVQGVMPVGDVVTDGGERDGQINEADVHAVEKAIEQGDLRYDLTGDGVVDVSDLAVVVRNQEGTKPATPVHMLSSSVLAKSVEFSLSEGVEVESGKIEDLLSQDPRANSVKLRPKDASAPVSGSNPIEFEITKKNADADRLDSQKSNAIVIAPPAPKEAGGEVARITAGEVAVVGINNEGTEVTITKEIEDQNEVKSAKRAAVFMRQSLARAFELYAEGDDAQDQQSERSRGVTVESDGSIVINLGTQIAIKKVTIRVTATANQANLAEIAKVEFLSDFTERIPEPQLSIPTVQSASNTESDGLGYKNLTVSWTAEKNVTGYEVNVSGPGYNKTASSTGTSYTFQGDSFNGTVKSFQTYQIKVRSVNGEWRSAWSEPYSHYVTCTKVPPAPQYVSVTGMVERLGVSWNCKYDAEWFTLYWQKSGASEWQKIENIKTTSATIEGLEGGVRYTVYVVVHNRNGASPKSSNAEGDTLGSSLAQMPKYALLNTDDASGSAVTGIESIDKGYKDKSFTIYRADGTTVDQTTATADDWKALLDNNSESYVFVPDWDSGVSYANYRGPTVTLSQKTKLDTIRFTPSDKVSGSITSARIGYKKDDGSMAIIGATLTSKADSERRQYMEVITDEPITTDVIELRLQGSSYVKKMSLSELKIYRYDSLDDDIAAIFSDDARTMVRPDIAESDIQALMDRVNTVDSASGEYHPHRAMQLQDLNYAMDIVKNNVHVAEMLSVDNQITATGNVNSGFAQTLSDYQPLGQVAAAGDVVVVYVSTLAGNVKKGSNANLKLIATQYHPQVSAWQSSAYQLKVGRNEITIPRVGSDATERGGSLYLQYTGDKGALNYQVRVTGATQIPTLNLDGVSGEARTEAIGAYVSALGDYVSKLPSAHDAVHASSDNSAVNAYGYDAKSCFLNQTEITLENMMYSVPATQVWDALGSGDKAAKLASAISAMEQEIDYFYQFKGMNRAATDNDAYPNTRLNIRYHQMFTGAFMYAGGKHIGIEWGSVPELFGITPIQTTGDKGKYESGNLTGWGIAHEIGHCINAASYQRVEVTNNVYAQLAKSDVDSARNEQNGGFRVDYDSVYKSVATGTMGHTGNLGVQLAQYWQLHLAYDNDYKFKHYDSIQSQQSGLFYARVESYLRDKTKANPELASTNGDQGFMQAACAAAGKDVLDYFRAWGWAPDATTISYAAKFPKETRKIQYINDDARLWRIEGKQGMSAGTTLNANITNAVNQYIEGNSVEISLGNTNSNADAMLGYEIKRNGKVVAFVAAGKTSYTDIVTTENNKAFTYTITGIDKLLAETDVLTLPEVKVKHDGSISKDRWTVTTNMTSGKDQAIEYNDNDPDGAATESAISAAFDNNKDTVFFGSGTSSKRPQVTLNLGAVEQVSAIKFTPASNGYSGDASEGSNVAAADLYKYRLFGYKIELSTDGENWTLAKEGSAYTGNAANPSSWVKQEGINYNSDGSYSIFFTQSDSKYLNTYDASYVRVTASDMSQIAIAELDVLGPTSDNVELVPSGYGKLKEDYYYAEGADASGNAYKIPAGSAVFYGEYKGDPAYNVVLLEDQDGNVLDGQQIVLAPDPEDGMLGAVSDGQWIFWMENKDKTDDQGASYNEFNQLQSVEKVQAVLYRVQNAQTMAGQRVTSTSLTMTKPDSMPDVTLEGSKIPSVVGLNAAEVVSSYKVEGDQLVGDDGSSVPIDLAESQDEETQSAGSIAEENPLADGIAVGDTGATSESALGNLIQLKATENGISFELSPASIAMASDGVIVFDKKLPSNAKIEVGTESGIYTGYARIDTKNTNGDDITELHIYSVAPKGAMSHYEGRQSVGAAGNGEGAASKSVIRVSGTVSGLTQSVNAMPKALNELSETKDGFTGRNTTIRNAEPVSFVVSGNQGGDNPGGNQGGSQGGNQGDNQGGSQGGSQDGNGGGTPGSSDEAFKLEIKTQSDATRVAQGGKLELTIDISSNGAKLFGGNEADSEGENGVFEPMYSASDVEWSVVGGKSGTSVSPSKGAKTTLAVASDEVVGKKLIVMAKLGQESATKEIVVADQSSHDPGNNGNNNSDNVTNNYNTIVTPATPKNKNTGSDPSLTDTGDENIPIVPIALVGAAALLGSVAVFRKLRREQ